MSVQLKFSKLKSAYALPGLTSLSSFYRGGPYIPDNVENAGIPTTGNPFPISTLSNLQGIVATNVAFPPVGFGSMSPLVSGQAYGNGQYQVIATNTLTGPVNFFTPAYWAFNYSISDFYVATLWFNNIYNGTGYCTDSVNFGVTYYDVNGSSFVATGEKIGLQFPFSVVLKSYFVQAPNDNYSGFPQDWVILGSNDNTTWYLLDSRTNITWTSLEQKTFTVSSNSLTANSYNRIIFICTRIRPFGPVEWSAALSISEMRFTGDQISKIFS